MGTTSLTLDEIYALAHDAMMANGCDDENAAALAVTERPEQVVHILRYVLEGTLP